MNREVEDREIGSLPSQPTRNFASVVEEHMHISSDAPRDSMEIGMEMKTTVFVPPGDGSTPDEWSDSPVDNPSSRESLTGNMMQMDTVRLSSFSDRPQPLT